MRSFLKTCLTLLLLCAVAFVAGLFWFVAQIPREAPTTLEQTDAIVVLTGGSMRVAAGLELLEKGLGHKLFISGAGKGLNVPEVIGAVRKQRTVPDCCDEKSVVVLGFDATDTVGNAMETAQRVEHEGWRSIRLVTANYHLPRAMREFSRAMPDVRLVPYPVFPESVRMEAWWYSPGTLSLVVSEYVKFLLSALWHGVMP